MDLTAGLGVTEENIGEFRPREADKIGAERIGSETRALQKQHLEGAVETPEGFLTIEVTLNEKCFKANVEKILLLRTLDSVGDLSDAEMNIALEHSSFYRANFVVAWATAKRIHKATTREYQRWYAQMAKVAEDSIRKNRRRTGVTAMGISASQVETEIMSNVESRPICIRLQEAIDEAEMNKDILEGVLDAISANGILLTSLAKRMLELRTLTVKG